MINATGRRPSGQIVHRDGSYLVRKARSSVSPGGFIFAVYGNHGSERLSFAYSLDGAKGHIKSYKAGY